MFICFPLCRALYLHLQVILSNNQSFLTSHPPTSTLTLVASFPSVLLLTSSSPHSVIPASLPLAFSSPPHLSSPLVFSSPSLLHNICSCNACQLERHEEAETQRKRERKNPNTKRTRTQRAHTHTFPCRHGVEEECQPGQRIAAHK